MKKEGKSKGNNNWYISIEGGTEKKIEKRGGAKEKAREEESPTRWLGTKMGYSILPSITPLKGRKEKRIRKIE